jgi:hypothetical protein
VDEISVVGVRTCNWMIGDPNSTAGLMIHRHSLVGRPPQGAVYACMELMP